MKKLSATQICALVAIAEHGPAIRLDGGTWSTESTARAVGMTPTDRVIAGLVHFPAPRHSEWDLLKWHSGVQTLRALERRGLLHRPIVDGCPDYFRPYHITDTGREAVGRKDEPMTDLEALAIRINELTPGLMVSAEMLEHVAQALALDGDARILFFAQVAKRQVEAEQGKPS